MWGLRFWNFYFSISNKSLFLLHAGPDAGVQLPYNLRSGWLLQECGCAWLCAEDIGHSPFSATLVNPYEEVYFHNLFEIMVSLARLGTLMGMDGNYV
jgi:hypothetical protein